MVDLKIKPFYLDAEGIQWVKDTLKSMTVEEKIGQLFIHLFQDFEPDNAKKLVNQYPIGGARYMGADSAKIQKLINALQQESKIPLLVAANCDSGGNGACKDGTYIATSAAADASNDNKVAYDTGYVSGREEQALGVNWNFDPCVDILYNWRNTIVNTRAFGNEPDRVIRFARQYLDGLSKSNVASCIKHFPGDGTEERDQHLVLGVNEFNVEEWDNSFGKVYKTLIDDGVMSIMAGHIALPAYQYKINPKLTYGDIMPATLSPELINGLLRDQLGFNGVVLTDASHMLGMTASMRRCEYVPKSIAAGCDMFLFFNDMEEDYNYMLEGYKNGIISKERLDEAVTRILGLKAAINLHKQQKNKELIREEKELAIIGCKDHMKRAAYAADASITLVKNTKNELPLRPETYKRIRLYMLFGELGGIHGTTKEAQDIIVDELTKAGFEVTINDGSTRDKGKISKYKEEVDAAIIFADIQGYANVNNVRIQWKTPMSSDIPWYVHEVPTVFVSLNFTTHLTDVPMVKAYINAYGNTREVIRQTIAKIKGDSQFKGMANELVFCDMWETRR